MMKYIYRIVTTCIAAVFLMGLVGCDNQPPPPPPKTVKIPINTQPQGATVFVNGSKQGETPCDLELDLGMNALITLRAQGHRPHMLYSSSICARDAHLKTITLQPFESVIIVKTTPEKASVTIDDSELGVSPVSTALSKGAYKLKVQLPGHSVHERNIIVDDQGTPQMINVNLTSRMGKVTIQSNVTGAEVSINGVSKGTAPYTGDLEEGNYVIEVSKTGYASSKRDFLMNADAVETIHAVLSDLPGTIEVSAKPSAASISIDGVLYGTGSISASKLTPGEHKIEVSCEGYDTIEETVILARDGLVQTDYDLVRNTGSIEVNSAPGGLTVYINGKKYGVTQTSKTDRTQAETFVVSDLPAGDYVVRVGHKDATPAYVEETVTLEKAGVATTSPLKLWVINAYVRAKNGVVTRGYLRSMDNNELKIEPNKGYIRTFKKSDVAVDGFKMLDISEK